MAEKQEMDLRSDEELVEIARSSSAQVYGEIVRRYQSKLYRYALYLTGDGSKASDVVQDAFIKAYVNLNGFNNSKKFSSWIYRIVHNEAINMAKKRDRNVSLDLIKDLPGDDDLEQGVERLEESALAKECLSSLPLKYAEPLELYYMEEQSYEEIGDILRLPSGTVATRIRRGKILMKRLCQIKKKK